MTSQFRKQDFVALFVTTAALTDLEICFLRLFSVTIWYHFAFLAISLAMFGLGASGLYLYLFPRRLIGERTAQSLPTVAALFALSTVAALFLYLQLYPRYAFTLAGGDLLVLAGIVVVLITPFFFAGMVLAIIFREWPQRISALYAFDLSGSAVGCLVGFFSLSLLSGLDAIFLAAIVAAIAALLFCTPHTARRSRVLPWAALAVAATLFIVNVTWKPVSIETAKGLRETNKVFEKWNSFSRVTVFDLFDPTPFMYDNYLERPFVNPGQKMMQIDASAASPITRFDGDPAKVDFMRWDLTEFQYFLRPEGEVCIIGLGAASVDRVKRRFARAGLTGAFVAVAMFVGLLANVLPAIFTELIRWPIALKIPLTIALIAPLGLAMGMCFPYGIGYVGEKKPELIPWLWGINGAASVLASVGAVFISLIGGFTVTLSVGALLYLCGAVLSRRVGDA